MILLSEMGHQPRLRKLFDGGAIIEENEVNRSETMMCRYDGGVDQNDIRTGGSNSKCADNDYKDDGAQVATTVMFFSISIALTMVVE